MDGGTQISAFISDETKKLLDEYTRKTGVKKSFVIEQALLHHLQALREIPPQFIIPTRMVLTKESGEKLLELLENPPKANAKLKRLMRRGR